MGRKIRPRLPGAPFHVTARLQGRAPHFMGVEAQVAQIFEDGTQQSDVRLLAYAIMPNHLHLVFVQGEQPLAGYMQPVLRRIALLLRKKSGLEGHVFERRYREVVCTDAQYLRNAIAYVHLNAVRAGICDTADQFPWSTHQRLCTIATDDVKSPSAFTTQSPLRLYAADLERSLEQCREDYLAFMSWRVEMDAWLRRREQQPGLRAPAPVQRMTVGGDRHFNDYFASAAMEHAAARIRKREDLRDFAQSVLDEIAPDLSLKHLCSGQRSRPLVRMRSQFIARALSAGYRGRTLAKFLQVSDTTVSFYRDSAAP